jgi:hypothetical protein
MKQSRIFILVILGVFAFSMFIYAAEKIASINSAYLNSQFGVKLSAPDATVKVVVGQVLDATVTDVKAVAKIGAKEAKIGDALQVVWLGKDKFNLIHVQSGNKYIFVIGTDGVTFVIGTDGVTYLN